MARLTNTWWKKAGIGILAVLLVCCVVGALVGRNNPRPLAASPTSGTIADAATPVATLVSIADATAASAATDAPPAPTDAPAPTAAAVALPKVGDDVKVDDIAWKVEEAVDAGDTIKSTNQYIKDLKTSGKFIRVRLTVQNNSSAQQSIAAANMELVDAKARTFKGDVTGEALMLLGDDSCGFEQLPAGLSKTCHLIFEVPKDASGLHFKASNLALLLVKVQEIDLGL